MATAAIIVVHAVCSVESRATLMPAGMRPCIVAMHIPTIPKASATSTIVNPSFFPVFVFLVFMFCGGELSPYGRNVRIDPVKEST